MFGKTGHQSRGTDPPNARCGHTEGVDDDASPNWPNAADKLPSGKSITHKECSEPRKSGSINSALIWAMPVARVAGIIKDVRIPDTKLAPVMDHAAPMAPYLGIKYKLLGNKIAKPTSAFGI